MPGPIKSIRIPIDLAEHVKIDAARRGVSFSRWIQVAIEDKIQSADSCRRYEQKFKKIKTLVGSLQKITERG